MKNFLFNKNLNYTISLKNKNINEYLWRSCWVFLNSYPMILFDKNYIIYFSANYYSNNSNLEEIIKPIILTKDRLINYLYLELSNNLSELNVNDSEIIYININFITLLL